VDANGVAIDTGSTVDFSADTPVWTFGNETTAEGLFVTGTPQDANHVPNKSYVDSAVSGLAWQDPVYVKEYVGNAAASVIEGLSPSAGDSYVVTTADGAGALSTATVGDVWEYSGSAWNLIIAGAGGFVPAGIRLLASIQTALIAPLTDATDDGKIAEFSGSSNTPSLTTSLAGWAVLVTDQDADGDSIYANYGYTYQGTVPTGAWVQFTGAGQINAGAGLAKSGNTINVGDVNKGVQANANDLQVDASEVASNGLEQVSGAGNEHLLQVKSDVTTGGNVVAVDVTANGVGLDVDDIDGTGLEADGSGALRLATQGSGIAGGNGSTLSFDAAACDGNGLSGAGNTLTVDSDTETGGNIQGVNVTANGVGLDVSAIAGTNLEADGSANLRIAASAAGNGLTGGGASALAVGQGNGITVNADDVAVNPAALIADGAAEIDGDKLDIDWVPSNYTRDSGPAQVDQLYQLTSHLKGIDNFLATAGGTVAQESVTTQVITGTDTALTDTLNNTPSSAATVRLYLNGVFQVQGAGADYTIAGSTITWLASSGTAVDMDTSDVLIAVYEY
jgi:hypothetical protein